jgi:hypothetical protein
VPHACEASSASRTIRSVDSAARRAGPEPAAPRRRVVWECHPSPPLPWSGGCHMLAKQAVLAEPTEASTARPEGPVPPAAPKGAAAAATAQRTGPPLRGALSWARGVQLALLPRCARKHVAPAGRWPAASCDIPTQNAVGLSSAASCDIPAQIAAAPLERRVPHACEASSASRTIRSVDSAARRAGPEPAAPRRRVVWECHTSPPLQGSGGNGTGPKGRSVVGSRGSASTASSLRSEARGTRRPLAGGVL